MSEASPSRPRFPFSPLEWTFVAALILILIAAGTSRLVRGSQPRREIANGKDLMILYQAQDSFARQGLGYAFPEELMGTEPYLGEFNLGGMLPNQWANLGPEAASTCVLETGYRVSIMLSPDRKSWGAVAWPDDGIGASFSITHQGKIRATKDDLVGNPWTAAFPSGTAPDFAQNPEWNPWR